MSNPHTPALYAALKEIILKTPKCPDGQGMACASCLATALAEAINNPATTPLEAVVGDIPVFSAIEVQSLINDLIAIDREGCKHPNCSRSQNANVLLMPV